MTDARTQLLEVLKQATSQDYAQMRQAEALLKQWENSPSFFATLQVHPPHFIVTHITYVSYRISFMIDRLNKT
jgi:hypothetical protein